MSSNKLLQISRAKSESEEAFHQRKELTHRIYDAILPLLGPDQAKDLIQKFNTHLEAGPAANINAVVDQTCEVCRSPMKIDEYGEEDHHFIICTSCGYMDVLKK